MQPTARATVLAAGIPPDLVVVLIFLGLGLLGHILRSLQEWAARRARAARGARDGDAARAGSPGEMRQPADEPRVDELERSGAELWRRLLEGLEPEARRPEVVHVPAPARVEAERVPERSLELPVARPAEPAPGPALVEVLPPAAAPELAEPPLEPVLSATDLDAGREASSADEPFFVLSAGSDESLAPSEDSARSSHPLPGGARAELWRAVLWSEILAPPLALRAPEEALTGGARSALLRSPGHAP